MEAAHRTALAKDDFGIIERKPVPRLKNSLRIYLPLGHVLPSSKRLLKRGRAGIAPS